MLLTANLPQPWNSITTTKTLIHHYKTLNDINQIHAHLITTGFIKNPNFTTKLILNFCNSSHTPLIKFAHHILLSQQGLFTPKNGKIDPFLFNAVIKSLAFGNYEVKLGMLVFIFMLEKGFCPDKYSFSLVLKACCRGGFLKEGMQIHGLLRKFDFGVDLYLRNCLISLYAKCGCVDLARQVFDKMPEKDSVSYNAMIDGYMKAGLVGIARELFDSMAIEQKNLRTWNCMIGGYIQSEGDISKAVKLFDQMPKRDLVTWNLLINGHAKCKNMEVASDLFHRMPKRDVISWATMIDGYVKIGNLNIARDLFDQAPIKDIVICNAMMAGYVKNEKFIDALNFFHDILGMNNLFPDKTTLSIVLSTISQLGRIDEGVAIHSYINTNGFTIDGIIGVALIDMYSKCGCVENAIQIFENLELKEVDHWNAMIGGLAIHGLGELAFELFMEMQTLLVKPDDITSIGVLNACGHSGLLEEGKICFEIMRRINNLDPKVQHYGCIVDMLSRAGQLKEAKKFIDDMPIEANNIIWRTMLSSCIIHENFIIGKEIAEELIRVDDFSNSGSYVLLSNMYAGFGMWGEVSRIRGEMGSKALKKLPGCSSIEVNGDVFEFFVADQSHPLSGEVYSVVDGFCASGLGGKSKLESVELEFVS